MNEKTSEIQIQLETLTFSGISTEEHHTQNCIGLDGLIPVRRQRIEEGGGVVLSDSSQKDDSIQFHFMFRAPTQSQSAFQSPETEPHNVIRTREAAAEARVKDTHCSMCDQAHQGKGLYIQLAWSVTLGYVHVNRGKVQCQM